MRPEQKGILEELRDLAATIEDLETERVVIPAEQLEHGALMLEARRLRRQRRSLVLAAAQAGIPTIATAVAAHVEPRAVTELVRGRARKQTRGGT